jgi:hypothetical protein
LGQTTKSLVEHVEVPPMARPQGCVATPVNKRRTASPIRPNDQRLVRLTL